jgi:hypothetical protein
MDDPFVVRMIKEIAQNHALNGHHLVFISHDLKVHADLRRFTALSRRQFSITRRQFSITLPDRDAIKKLLLSELQI